MASFYSRSDMNKNQQQTAKHHMTGEISDLVRADMGRGPGFWGNLWAPLPSASVNELALANFWRAMREALEDKPTMDLGKEWPVMASSSWSEDGGESFSLLELLTEKQRMGLGISSWLLVSREASQFPAMIVYIHKTKAAFLFIEDSLPMEKKELCDCRAMFKEDTKDFSRMISRVIKIRGQVIAGLRDIEGKDAQPKATRKTKVR